jgi:hypothetical protein
MRTRQNSLESRVSEAIVGQSYEEAAGAGGRGKCCGWRRRHIRGYFDMRPNLDFVGLGGGGPHQEDISTATASRVLIFFSRVRYFDLPFVVSLDASAIAQCETLLFLLFSTYGWFSAGAVVGGGQRGRTRRSNLPTSKSSGRWRKPSLRHTFNFVLFD